MNYFYYRYENEQPPDFRKTRFLTQEYKNRPWAGQFRQRRYERLSAKAASGDNRAKKHKNDMESRETSRVTKRMSRSYTGNSHKVVQQYDRERNMLESQKQRRLRNVTSPTEDEARNDWYDNMIASVRHRNEAVVERGAPAASTYTKSNTNLSKLANWLYNATTTQQILNENAESANKPLKGRAGTNTLNNFFGDVADLQRYAKTYVDRYAAWLNETKADHGRLERDRADAANKRELDDLNAQIAELNNKMTDIDQCIVELDILLDRIDEFNFEKNIRHPRRPTNRDFRPLMDAIDAIARNPLHSPQRHVRNVTKQTLQTRCAEFHNKWDWLQQYVYGNTPDESNVMEVNDPRWGKTRSHIDNIQHAKQTMQSASRLTNRTLRNL